MIKLLSTVFVAYENMESLYFVNLLEESSKLDPKPKLAHLILFSRI